MHDWNENNIHSKGTNRYKKIEFEDFALPFFAFLMEVYLSVFEQVLYFLIFNFCDLLLTEKVKAKE